MNTLTQTPDRTPDSDPPPPVPYFRALPEPHWDVIDAWRAEFLEATSRIARALDLPPAV